MLEHEGYAVDEAANGAEGLRLAIAHRPDAVVTDVSMPEADGADLLDGLAAHGMADVPAVVISANAPPARLRTRHFLSKPFDVDDVLAMVTALTQRLAA
jgi:two-component system, OmpR family, KDP operon response regulator KdpE